MKKKLFVSIALLTLVATMIVTLVACKPKKLEVNNLTELPKTYEGMEVVEEMNALDLFNEAYANFLAADDYKRIQNYSMESKVMNMYIHSNRKINGNKVYQSEVVLGSGVMKLHEGRKLYFDGDKAWSLYFNDEKRVPGKGEDKFAVTEWIDFREYNLEDNNNKEAAPTKKKIKEHMVSYDTSKLANMAANNNNTVYTKEGLYYFTLTIDCSKEAMSTIHTKVVEDIIEKTGGKKEDLKMNENTTIQVAVEMINDKPMIRALQTVEKYSGKLAVFSADIVQIYTNEFDWSKGAGVATAEELGNLA